MIKIVLFEDHPIVAIGLQILFDATDNLDMQFHCSNKEDLYAMLDRNDDIDILIIDFLADGVFGTEVYEYVNLKFPKIKTWLIFT